MVLVRNAHDGSTYYNKHVQIRFARDATYPTFYEKSDFVRLVRSNSLSYNKIGKKANNPQTFDPEPDLH